MGLLDPIWDAFKKTGLFDAMYIYVIEHYKDILQPDRFKFIELQAKKIKKLDLDLCILAIFCHPKTRKFAISKKTTLLDIQTTAIKLVKKWNWNRESAVDIKNGLADYLNFIGDFNLDKGIPIDDSRIYWDHNEIDSEEIYNINDWDDNINDTLTSIELKDELETFFEEEQVKLKDITNLTPKFIIEQLVDINDPIFYNQTVLNNFIDKSLVMDENNDSDCDINSIIDN
ncbi:19837_t:CDS:2, partial [Racocetra fulgida]